MNKLFSVIVPVYNVEKKLLNKCISSIINQTYRNIEIIIVDDGSNEKTANICEQFLKVDKRINVIHQNNKGLCGARNAGQEKAKGDWILFVDGDDWIEENSIEILNNKIKQNTDIICFDFFTDLSKNTLNSKHGNFFEYEKTYSSEEELKYIRSMCLNFYAECCSSWCKAYKRNFLLENNIMHDEILKQGAEDIDFSFRIFSNKCNVIFINDYLYHYIFNNNSITRKFNESNQILAINCLQKVRNMIDNNDIETLGYFFSKVLQVVIAAGINGYFSDSNKVNYKIKRKMYSDYLKQDIIIEALNTKIKLQLDKKRRIIVNLIRKRIFLPIVLLSKIKYRNGGKKE